MIVFDVPFSRFTATELLTLCDMWPETRHCHGPEADSLLVIASDGGSWLSISRHVGGGYRAVGLAGRIFAEGRRLSDLALDGPG